MSQDVEDTSTCPVCAGCKVCEHDSNDSNDAVEGSNTPPKKRKRLVRYGKDWEDDFPWLVQVNRDIFKGHCTMCHKEISVAHGGKADVHHSVSACHKRAEAAASARAISMFFVRSAPRSAVDQQVIRSDLLTVTTMSSDKRLVYDKCLNDRHSVTLGKHSAGAPPGPRWGSSRRSPRPLVGWGPLPISHPLDAFRFSASAPSAPSAP